MSVIKTPELPTSGSTRRRKSIPCQIQIESVVNGNETTADANSQIPLLQVNHAPSNSTNNSTNIVHVELEPSTLSYHLLLAMRLSLLVNLLLFLAKTYSALVSHSLSVGASAGESFLDLASEIIVVLAERRSKVYDVKRYPVGRTKLEPIGIILCASLMSAAALQLILESGSQLWRGVIDLETPKHVIFNGFTITLLALNILAKLGLWIYCAAYSKYSPTLYTLAVDHRNDVLSNIVALIAAVLSWKWHSIWSADPIGAILMSFYICWNWFRIGNEQIEMIVGRAADPEFIEEIRALSANFHNHMTADIIRAYHFGAKYMVEVEVILPAEMTVRESHMIAHSFQETLEQLPSVERAFIHVDHQPSDGRDRHHRQELPSPVLGAPRATGFTHKTT